MRVLVTGATGFVGARFLRTLVDTTHHEVGLLVRTGSSPHRILDLLSRTTVIRGDVSEIEKCSAAVERFEPEAIVHLAWSGVLGRDRNRHDQWRNVCATMDLLELGRRCGIAHFIGLGSQAEYGPCSMRVSEDQPTRPTTLYGVAKLSCSLLAEALCHKSDIRFAWLRLFSAYGPADSIEWLIPYLIVQLLSGKRPRVTAAEQRWDYIHVQDVANALIRVLDEIEARGVFNLGSGQARPLRSIIEMIRDMIDPSLAIGFGEVPYRPDQIMHLEAAIERLVDATGWQPATTLESGLLETLSWYREHAPRLS